MYAVALFLPNPRGQNTLEQMGSDRACLPGLLLWEEGRSACPPCQVPACLP